MLDALSQRTVVIGISGSDKSSLAEHLAARSKIPAIELRLRSRSEVSGVVDEGLACVLRQAQDEAVSFVAP
jgi:adenylate kinase family enzyme